MLGGIIICSEHGFPCYGASRDYAPVYASGSNGCYIGIPREPADHLIRDLVIARLQRSDAAELLEVHHDQVPLEQEAAELRRRREEMTGLIAEGLLPTSSARPHLQEIAARLAEIESAFSASSTLPTPSSTLQPLGIAGPCRNAAKSSGCCSSRSRCAMRHRSDRKWTYPGSRASGRADLAELWERPDRLVLPPAETSRRVPDARHGRPKARSASSFQAPKRRALAAPNSSSLNRPAVFSSPSLVSRARKSSPEAAGAGSCVRCSRGKR